MEFSFKNYFDEAITNMMFHGNWGPKAKNKYGYDKKDLGILQNPNATEKIMRIWEKTGVDFEIHFVRSSVAKDYIELGQVPNDWAKSTLGIDIQPQKDTITIIFTQNKGTEKIPMTAWALAHRFGHAIRREKIFQDHFYSQIMRDFRELILNVYKVDIKHYSWQSSRYDEPVLLNFAHAIGTMRSARERKLVNYFEFIYEILAQYLITGKIKFNPLPKKLKLQHRMAWGKENHLYAHSHLSEKEFEEYNEQLQNFAEVYEYNLDSVFGSLLNKIFVM